MRIRKRSQSVAATTPLPQPISFKYHTGLSPPGSQGRFRGPSIDHSQAVECSNMQAKANRGLEDLEDHEDRATESPRFDVNAEPPVSPMAILWGGSARVKYSVANNLSGAHAGIAVVT